MVKTAITISRGVRYNKVMKKSAGILVYKRQNNQVYFLLAHNGGPFFKNKDEGFWTIPKGEIEEDEDELSCAKREFEEELGLKPPDGDYQDIGVVKQKNNKQVFAWAVEADLDVSKIDSNTFEMEWPPRSGQMKEFPEIDKAEWFTPAVAKKKANQAQVEFLDKILEHLSISEDSGEQVTLL